MYSNAFPVKLNVEWKRAYPKVKYMLIKRSALTTATVELIADQQHSILMIRNNHFYLFIPLNVHCECLCTNKIIGALHNVHIPSFGLE